MATHSPHPSLSGVTTRTSSTSRLVAVPKEVRNGDTRGMRMRRSSTAVTFTELLRQAAGSGLVRRRGVLEAGAPLVELQVAEQVDAVPPSIAEPGAVGQRRA